MRHYFSKAMQAKTNNMKPEIVDNYMQKAIDRRRRRLIRYSTIGHWQSFQVDYTRRNQTPQVLHNLLT